MPSSHQAPLETRILGSLAGVPAAQWDSLFGGETVLRHAFLHALEASGCAAAASGWQARHLTLWRGDRLCAALPLYRKDHSYGEFVFDWAWAEAYQRAGLAYYPKLLSAVPFSPIPGPRLAAVDEAARAPLIEAALGAARDSALSSWHVLFPTEADAARLAEAGLMLRHDVQFHWRNAGYRDFADFLDGLSRDKRKKIRQERRRVAAAGIACRRLTGAQASAADWRFFHRCHARTYAERGRLPYLNEDFFARLAATLPECLLLVIAERAGRPVAAALDFVSPGRLLGRYWGALEFVPGLHFEACYYQGIEWCIEHGVAVFEGGAQGEHKLARGFLPVRTVSAHWLRDLRFADAVERYLARESAAVGRYVDELNEHSPFRE